MVTIIFQISNATPKLSLLIRVIRGLKAYFKYLWDWDEICFTKQLKDGECNGDNYFSNFWCHAYNAYNAYRLLIRVISDLKVNFKYLWDWDEMFFTKQLKDGECNSDNSFSNFWCHAYN